MSAGTLAEALGHPASWVALPARRSLAWRESPAASAVDRLYATEDAPPDPVCVSYQHDRDSARFVPYPDAAAEASFRGQSWCPPQGKEYAGFEEEDPLEAAAAP